MPSYVEFFDTVPDVAGRLRQGHEGAWAAGGARRRDSRPTPSVDWKADELKAVVAGVAEGQGLKLAKAQAPVRVAVTGRTVGPPLFESLEILGRDETLARLRAARARL